MIYCLIFILGSIWGSFIYCISDSNNIFRRSRCDNCRHVLTVMDLVPIISFIVSRGKCRYCKKQISFYYPLSEIIMGILFILLYLKYRISFKSLEMFILVSILFSISSIDIKKMIIPEIHLLLIILEYICFNYKKINEVRIINSFIFHLSFFFFVYLSSKVKKKELMGMGDIKLLFVLGIYLDNYENLLLLLFSSILGLIYGLLNNKNKEYFAFGPFICTSFVLINLFKDNLYHLF